MGVPAYGDTENVTRRFGIFIGSNNGGQGRTMLRYAVSDARAIAKVFSEMGGIGGGDAVLLVEPGIREINRRIDELHERVLGAKQSYKRTEIVFYYSGHSDESGLLLDRERYDYKDLRERINTIPSDMRIVILDSCSSGAFTRAKGGAKTRPFLIDSSISAEGYAFLTSSSATEASQESDRIGSSYFTHSLLAGLRGAADSVGDGRVTLNEVYRFTYSETLAKTETSRYGAQHPSYDIQINGSGDVVLTDIKEISAGLVIDANILGRLSIRDSSDHLIAEISKTSPKPMELGLQPGLYRITLQTGETLFRAEVSLAENSRTPITQADFRLIPGTRAALRGEAEEHPDIPLGFQVAPGAGTEKADNNVLLGFPLANGYDLNAAGVAVAGLMNEGSVRGFQMSGLFNMSGNVNGLQLAGLVNASGADITGIQASGLLNIAGMDVQGAEIAGMEMFGFQMASIANIAGANVSGLQFGGVFNMAGGNVNGGQASSVFNTAWGDVRGLQFGGLFNMAGGNIRGLQMAGIFDSAGGDVSGLQVSGIFGYAGGNFQGAQVSGIASYTHGDFFGLEFAGMFNYAGESFRGVQAGLVNIAAADMRGLQFGLYNQGGGDVQIGLVNISDNESSFPIGIVNIVKDGILSPVLWYDSMNFANIGLKSGSKHIYTLVSAGTRSAGSKFGADRNRDDSILVYRVGLGIEIPLGPVFIDFDVLTGNIFNNNISAEKRALSDAEDRFDASSTQIVQIRLSLGFEIFDHVSAFVGVSYDYLNPLSNTSPNPANRPRGVTFDWSDSKNIYRMGAFGGIQY
jgi:hypothetical protein